MAPSEREVAEAMKLRVFFIPYFATSHIIPMFQLAELMTSTRPGVDATMFLTPANASLVRPSDSLRLRLRLHLYPFTSAEVGLPPNLENISSVSSSESWKLDKAVGVVRDTLDPIIRRDQPDVLIVDYHYWWAIHTAHDLNIPGVSFAPIGIFPQVVLSSLLNWPASSGAGDNERFAVPGLPGPPIEMVKSELPAFVRVSRGTRDEEFAGILHNSIEAQRLRFGLVANTFYELEPDYCDHFRKTQCGRTWFVGPIALAVGDTTDVCDDRCVKWLDGREEGSVVFACFGSWGHFAAEQLREMALGLEASGRAFLWVVRGGDTEGWMPEGWEERVEGRGMLERGWAPQRAILGHPAVGAFMTHCGWNSVLEAASAGVPVLTWPLVVEQFINERLVVGVMGVGVRMWEGYRSAEEEEKVVVPGDAIGRAVSEFMKAGGAREEARRRAREYAAMAKAAVGEGGSSRRDLERMVEELMEAAGKGRESSA